MVRGPWYLCSLMLQLSVVQNFEYGIPLFYPVSKLISTFFLIVAPCILKSTQFTHQQMHYLLRWLKVLNLHKQYTIISLLPVSVFNDHHQGVLSVPNLSYIYVKTLGKITSLYELGDVAACRRAACVLCAVQSETVERRVCCVQCRVRL